MKKILLLLSLFLFACQNNKSSDFFGNKKKIDLHLKGSLSINLSINDNYDYSLKYENQKYDGTYNLINLGNDSFDDRYSKNLCEIYQIVFSKIDVKLPSPLDYSFNGLNNNEILYYFFDENNSPYGCKVYIERINTSSQLVDSEGNVTDSPFKDYVFIS